ncbi:MAG: UDP-N-acetylmuramate dehydrogenase [Candidatus Electrothrix sp. EH2]|nr:UDP-N-acetylmuramate dehydrogenase [Candidatus Electrothrix sp. EH2]
MNQQQREKLAAMTRHWPSLMQFDVPMASYSTLRAGGKAAALIDVHSLVELQMLLRQLHEQQLVFRVIGRGSNILVKDKGFPGVIIRLKGEFENISPVQKDSDSEENREDIVHVGSGCSLGRLLSWCTGQGLSGLECMTGIPGSVGGAVRMNAGALGGEISDCLHSLVLLDADGTILDVLKSELQFSYRRAGWGEKKFDTLIVAFAVFSLKPEAQERIRSRCAAFLAQRKGKQPTGVASAGSFFKNPAGDAAGRLIDAAGLKGHCCGEAMISPVHANFIVNTGGSSAADILALMEEVQETVLQRFSVKLEPEVEIL